MISVVIRNKNQQEALSFLLKNLTERYADDISEIIVLDNLSTDESRNITEKYGARFVTIAQFSYGGSANYAAAQANNDIIVIFSAHSYPVSHDFFKVIRTKFDANPNLAGVRCLHSANDFKAFINKIPAKEDPDKAGLIFSGSAFRKSVWETIPFNDKVPTFEDKEWTKRVLRKGYDIEFAEAIFHYDIKRTKKQVFFRFKNDIIGNYQIWHKEVTFFTVVKFFTVSMYLLCKETLSEIGYVFLRTLFMLRFISKKPQKFDE